MERQSHTRLVLSWHFYGPIPQRTGCVDWLPPAAASPLVGFARSLGPAARALLDQTFAPGSALAAVPPLPRESSRALEPGDGVRKVWITGTRVVERGDQSIGKRPMGGGRSRREKAGASACEASPRREW